MLTNPAWLSLMTFASASQFHTYLQWVNICLASCESTSRYFQPGEGPSRGLLRDCEKFGKGSFEALVCGCCQPPHSRLGQTCRARCGHSPGHHWTPGPACNLSCLRGNVLFISPQSSAAEITEPFWFPTWKLYCWCIKTNFWNLFFVSILKYKSVV